MWGAFYLSQEEALNLAFPVHVKIDRLDLFLKKEQVIEIQKLAKSKLESELITYYAGWKDGKIQGYAFFDSHIVRTMPETLMVVLEPSGKLKSVEILAFHEPEDYKPPKKWLAMFEGKELDNKLWVKRGLRNISGATLSTHAITSSVRRIMAIFNTAVKLKEPQGE